MAFKFTYPNSNLSEEQKILYEENGYLLVKNNVNEDLLDEIIKRFTGLCDGVNDTCNSSVGNLTPSLKNKYMQGQHVSKIPDLLYDKIFWKYCTYPKLIKIVEGIIGPNITAVNSMFFKKPTNVDPGTSHLLYQDLQYFPFRPANKIVTSWTALERIDEKNGSIYVVPGSHVGSLYKPANPKECKNTSDRESKHFEHLPGVNLIMEKGDTVFFHPLLLHGSSLNSSQGNFGKTISCHYAANDCYFIDIREKRHENIEVQVLFRRKGIGLDFLDMFQRKSRWVQGTSSVFQNFESHL